MRNESSIFFPRKHKHLVTTVSLDVSTADLPLEILSRIPRVLKRVEALRDLQTLEFNQRTPVFRELVEQLAAEIECIADLLGDPDSAESLRLRASMLRGADRKASSLTLSNYVERQLICFCGPLTTWLGKTKSTFYSAFFALPNVEYQLLSNTADAYLPVAMGELKALADPSIILGPVFEFQLTDLIAIAGEANLYPKHFAYFLPEDEGVKYAPKKRTVVFMNTYLALFNLIAREDAHKVLDVVDGGIDNAQVGKYLLTWFRGHDVGHSIAKAHTDFQIISKLDRWGSMQIQEALADTFGFLLCVTDTWSRCLGLKPALISSIFMHEMLRYMRRSPCDFPDAGAAFMELQFLLQNGFASIDRQRRKIVVTSTDLIKGMTALAKALCESALDNDTDKVRAFLARYSPQENPEEVENLQSLLGDANRTIDYVQPVYDFYVAQEANV